MKRAGRILIFLSFLGLVHCGQGLTAKKFSSSERSSITTVNNTNGQVSFRGNSSQEIQSQVTASCDASEASCQVVQKINEIRAMYKLSVLKIYKGCELAAQEHAYDMAFFQYFDHRGRDGSTPMQRLDRYGVFGFAVSENIAVGDDDIEKIVQSWMDSPGHRANILDPQLTHTGVGIALSEGNSTGYGNDIYYVQCFVAN